MAFYCSKWFQEFTVGTDGSSGFTWIQKGSENFFFIHVEFRTHLNVVFIPWSTSNLKILKIRSFFVRKSFSREIFSKPLLPTKNKRTANGRLIFPLTKSDLIRKLADENLYMNNNTSALNNNTPVKLNNAPLETHPLEKSFAIAANFIAAKCISCQTFA